MSKKQVNGQLVEREISQDGGLTHPLWVVKTLPVNYPAIVNFEGNDLPTTIKKLFHELDQTKWNDFH